MSILPKIGEGEEYEIKAADHRVVSDPKILAWREGNLVFAGFTAEHAIILAANADVDLHEACKLAATAGAELAYEILA